MRVWRFPTNAPLSVSSLLYNVNSSNIYDILVIWIECAWINRIQFISDNLPLYRKYCTSKANAQKYFPYSVLDGCAEGPAVDESDVFSEGTGQCTPRVCVCTDELCNVGSGAFHLKPSSPIFFPFFKSFSAVLALSWDIWQFSEEMTKKYDGLRCAPFSVKKSC